MTIELNPGYTIYDTATVNDSCPVNGATQEAESKPLDFEELKAADLVLKHACAAWLNKQWNAYYVLRKHTKTLIDLAQRCQVAERRAERAEQQYGSLWAAAKEERDAHRKERDDLTKQCEALQRQVDDLTSRLADLRETSECPPDCDLKTWVRVLAEVYGFWRKTEGGQAQQNPCESAAVLTSEDNAFLAHLRDCVNQRKIIGVPWGQQVVALIDRLLKAKGLPWIRVVDGKRPEGLDDEEKLVGIYCDGQMITADIAAVDSWYWPALLWRVPLFDLLETLPK
ncbi:hypothetical protein M0R72_10560 [Candidatus Pacearchaeota archaeon]|jgi:hypothetical protein|nr:hypothetical protein [Candidatus Pacearchaeota archaeon]